MIAQYLDLTDEFNANGKAYVEVSNYDYCVIQVIDNGDSFKIFSTIDSGAEQGVTDGNVADSLNYQQISFLDLADNTYKTQTTSNGNFLLKVGVVGRYLQLGESGALQKLLVMLAKIG